MSRRDELIEQYRILHAKRRYGASSEQLLGYIQKELDHLPQIQTLLDYGCGTSRLAEWLGKLNDAHAYRYDPAIPELDTMPVTHADLIINTDVLEHIAEPDLDSVLRDIRSISACAYFHIATVHARTSLPNGENAHVTVRPTEWWQELLQCHFETVRPSPAKKAGRSAFVTWEKTG